jgi:hypothetical protein
MADSRSSRSPSITKIRSARVCRDRLRRSSSSGTRFPAEPRSLFRSRTSAGSGRCTRAGA